ncbi:MAG: restriction endonuclease subunit S [Cylindrospermopsis raciborskii 1523720]|uniref:restriction endonuclease subunit S n=1 Tax=Cylindrospermopsis raciborskii TaxID=77022 RepID=UPI002B459245|nr:restriction endonuclease subunit S [Cylindrospermopsis raciborskii]MEB3146835.1 restriction endonuclease subunit S [Cylindrospermopsis raciborskii]
MKWLILPLEQIAEISGGSTPSRIKSEFWNGDIAWVTPTDLPMLGQGIAEINATTDYITELGLSSCSANLLPVGTVVFSSRATIGKIGISQIPLATNQGFTNFIPKPFIYNRFLAYSLQYYTPEITKLAGSTTFKEVSKSSIKKFKIPFPAPSEQRRIVEILDQADALRKMRAEADAKSDRILPALFIKMFGDPSTNPMGWNIVSVEKLFSKERSGTKCGPFVSALKKHEYVDNGVPVWGIDNIKPNQFLESGSLFITPTKYEELKSYTVEPGDIIISRAGTVGRMCVARPQQSPSIISTNLIRLTLDKKHISPEYFTSLLSYFPASVNQLRASGDDGAYSFMNTTILKSLKIPLPPFELQNEYTIRMAEIRRLNAKQIESQATLNHLFQSLLYQAFSGQLTAKWREAHIKELLAEMEEQAKILNLRDNGDYQQLSML